MGGLYQRIERAGAAFQASGGVTGSYRAPQKHESLKRMERPTDLAIFPGNRLEALKGNRAGQHSIRINNQFRICFVWRDGDAFEIEIADYH